MKQHGNHYPVVKLALLAALACAGCTPTWKHADRTMFVMAAASIACDWGQTRSAADENWSGGRHEANFMMGPAPDVGTVDAYMGMMLATTTLVWLVLPHKVGPFVMGGIVGAEANTIYGNMSTVRGTCGL